MINIYPSTLDGAPLEEHRTLEPMTLGAWLRANVKSYRAMDVAPISIHVNGELIDPASWDCSEFGPSDTVDIYPLPKGAGVGAFLVAYGGYIAAAIAVLAVLLMPKPASMNGGGQAQGSGLDLASAKGNQVKTNAPIREIAGKRKVYPDYLLPLRRYFTSPREQWVDMLLCVGKGKYSIPESRIQIGDTPAISLGEDVQFAIYQPGADLSAEPCAAWWNSCPEVGATSTGTSGLQLKATFAVSPAASASSYLFDGDTVTVPVGAGEFPTGWASGMIARIEVTYPYTVIDGGAGRDIIEGDLSQLAPFAGMVIEIVGDNEGMYVVESYTPGALDTDPDQMTLSYDGGAPVTGLLTGSVQMGIGYRGLRYRLLAASAQSISVERMTDTGATDLAWPGYLPLTTTLAAITLDGSTQEGDWCGPFAACPDGELTTAIEWDVMFPGGLIKITSKGDEREYSVTVEVQYRDIEVAGEWSSFVKTYSAKTLDQLGFTESLALPYAMRAEVRMRRIGAESTSTQRQDAAQWYGLRSRLNGPTSYEGVTVLAMRVRGGNRLAAQSEQLVSVEATRVLPVRNGGAWDVESPTRDIAPWIAHVARSIGYTDDDLDMTELDRLGEVWAARGDYFDSSVDSLSTVKQCLVDAMMAGFADITIDRGKIRPVRDEPRTTFEHMYTPQNMTEGLSRSFSARKPDDYDGVDVEYVDGVTWQKETVKCRLPGDIGQRVEKIQLEGVTSRTKAWRIGMRQRRSQKYRRWSYQWATELDALNSRYLSFCAVGDDVPGYGQSAIMLNYDSGIIESSEPFDWSDEGPHVVGIRRPDGTLSGPYAATQIDEYHLSIDGLDFEPDTSWSIEPPHLLFGPLNRWSYPVLITGITPNGTEGASVEAMNYDVRVYADDDNSPA